MELNYFKDQIFDLINEYENFDISRIITYDHENRFVIVMADGTVFEVLCAKIPLQVLWKL